MSKEQTQLTDKVLDNILFEISLCSSEYHKREVLKEEINAKVLEALEPIRKEIQEIKNINQSMKIDLKLAKSLLKDFQQK